MEGDSQGVTNKNSTEGSQENFFTFPPPISLPKGGGAIRGIGEKFAANPVTGTGSMSIPIATSPGRSDFGPKLSLSYDSASGNGPFGFGWSLSIPMITRKTDKGLPQYYDQTESDVFISSGSEDLVPFFNQDLTPYENSLIVDGVEYTIHRYRPRIEGLFARIERWTENSTGDIHWRSISKENILTIYGKDTNSRIADPGANSESEPPKNSRIFSWLICETRDDKGNAIFYEYKEEDGIGIDTTLLSERNRGATNDIRRTANKYIKRIKYGNRASLLDHSIEDGTRPHFIPENKLKNADWMFELVFDYGDHDEHRPMPESSTDWAFRNDPFSSYRSGFEVRTTRLCQRVLMFHHFPTEEFVREKCLVKSTDFTYHYEKVPTDKKNSIYTFLKAVTHSGYSRKADNASSEYVKSSMPRVEFTYSEAIVQKKSETVDAESLKNLPEGVDGSTYRWTDLHGEGISGILTEQANQWFYKPNLSPINLTSSNQDPSLSHKVEFAAMAPIKSKPIVSLAAGAQFMDLAGDGEPDVVVMEGPSPGFYEHDGEESWKLFKPFQSRLNRNMQDPNLKFLDLNGDGLADILITEHEAFIWHQSLGEQGFGPAKRLTQMLDEEQGPRLVFADGTESIYLSDMSGDGLTDLVRIRNGSTCYWPNLGYCKFGAKVSMDNAPTFDRLDQFNQKRIRLADIDGSGTTDIIYLHSEGIRLYFNQSGNGWSEKEELFVFPKVDNIVNIQTTDLLGNGTACLVWSSPLSDDAQLPMRYVNLMGSQKPHLLIKSINNMGAETQVHYAPSTKFYLKDKLDGNPWITKLPFPVHVVESVETYDHISKNRFTSRYKYHHGFFDGEEREFRGFGMVEQWDTEEFQTLSRREGFEKWENVSSASYLPPVYTKTWFHTGAYLQGKSISKHYEKEYYREPYMRVVESGDPDKEAKNQAFANQLLEDTVLPIDVLSNDELRQAHRALKGTTLRLEVYAQDGSEKEAHPYTVTEQNSAVKLVQNQGSNKHAVFFVHENESLAWHYERNPEDPRLQHSLTLEVNPIGQVLKQVAIGYGRRQSLKTLDVDGRIQEIQNAEFESLDVEDQLEQTKIYITYTENELTKKQGTVDDLIDTEFDYRTKLPSETRTYELTGYPLSTQNQRYRASDFVKPDPDDDKKRIHIVDKEIPYESIADVYQNPQPSQINRQRRLIEHLCVKYRKNNLSDLLPLGNYESKALAGESYKLAYTKDHATQLYIDSGKLTSAELKEILENEGRFIHLDGDLNWWIPSGRSYLSPNKHDTPANEHDFAKDNFYIPRRYRDPFYNNTNDTESIITLDDHNLLPIESQDAVNNTTATKHNYRVLQPALITDPNGNRTAAAFGALGMVVATAVMGKGDVLQDFTIDLSVGEIQAFTANPRTNAKTLLGKATTRIAYDLDRYQRIQQAPFAASLARETHVSDDVSGNSAIQIAFTYSDGFGREIEKKIQAEPGDAPLRSNPDLRNGDIYLGELVKNVEVELIQQHTEQRWVGSGRVIYNNKGKPIKQYEPFFSSTHLHEAENELTDTGVSPTLFYDPLERVIATLHPNRSFEKVIFDPWKQTTYDVNDTVIFDIATDETTRGFIFDKDGNQRLPEKDYSPSWYALRTKSENFSEFEKQYPDPVLRNYQTQAANKTSIHEDTPTVAHLDSLARPFLTIEHNRFNRKKSDGTDKPENQHYKTRVRQDIESNQREVIDARNRPVMTYQYYMAGLEKDENGEQSNTHLIYQNSMDSGERWMLNDVTGNPIRIWDSRGHTTRTEYDVLRRPLKTFVLGADENDTSREVLTDRLIYGEQHPDAEALNLRRALYVHLDQAGVARTEAIDFKGNPEESSRQIILDYKNVIDWSGIDTTLPGDSITLLDIAEIDAGLDSLMDGERYRSEITYDALNRPLTQTSPHTTAMKANIIRNSYNEANLLNAVDVNLRGKTNGGNLKWTSFVKNIDYDAKGQREKIEYGNNVTTCYKYDPFTFRLIHLQTSRNTANYPDDTTFKPGWPGSQVQNLHYIYDPAGNITHIHDNAQKAIYFKNRYVEPSNDYIYDAIYRLIDASGREHQSIAGTTIPYSHTDKLRTNRLHPADGNALGTYTEKYEYDEVGNILSMGHRDLNSNLGWKRCYQYAIDSNRLLSTGLQSDPGYSCDNPYATRPQMAEEYHYDPHGNMVHMPHLSGSDPDKNMHWNFRDQLKKIELGGGGEAFYIYDASGERVKKVVEKTATDIEERIYLGGFEIYKHNGAGINLTRETLHIMDDKHRIAMVETRSEDQYGSDSSSEELIRYQFGNHLDSVSLELNEKAEVISYEEYSTYGSTTFQSRNRAINSVAKRYRYTGMERDEESGLNYHSARYYATWLGRWGSPDPAGFVDGYNIYNYVKNNPIKSLDPDGKQEQIAGTGITENSSVYVNREHDRFIGTEAHNLPKHVLDTLRARINGTLLYQAFPGEFTTGPYGSSKNKSKSPGEIDLLISRIPNDGKYHIYDLKSVYSASSKKNITQVFNYATFLNAEDGVGVPGTIIEEIPFVLAPVSVEIPSGTRTYHLDFGRDENGKIIPGIITYDVRETRRVPQPVMLYSPERNPKRKEDPLFKLPSLEITSNKEISNALPLIVFGVGVAIVSTIKVAGTFAAGAAASVVSGATFIPPEILLNNRSDEPPFMQ